MTAIDLPSRYRILAKCGEGRYGDVYRATDVELQREVALKISRLSGRSKDETRQIRRELRVSCKLRHPNIASGFDGFEQDEHLVLCLPYLGGGTLADAAGDADETVSQTLTRFCKLCDAVAYMHRSGILHGDLKPENVLMDGEAKAYLTDFGSCLQLDKKTGTASSEATSGTPAYLSPELARGTAAPSIASEVYALGISLMELLCGQTIYDGDAKQVLHRIATEPLPSPRSLDSAIDRSLEAILLKACAEKPSQRYDSVDSFKNDLERFIANEPIEAKPPTKLAACRLWSKRNPVVAALAATLVLVMTCGTTLSTVGWAAALRTRARLVASQDQLAQRARQAMTQEQQLQTVLASIKQQQAAIERCNR